MKKLRNLLVALLIVSLLPMATAFADEPTTIKIGYLTWRGVPADIEKVENYVSENILIPKFNVKLDLVPINGGSYGEQANLFENDGTVDLIQLFGQNLWTLAANGQIEPLDELMAEYGQGILDVIDPDLWWGCQVDGETFCVPLLSRAYGVSWAIYVREDLCDKYNLTEENFRTTESLTEVLAMIKENEPDILPIAANGNILGYIVADPDEPLYSNTGDYCSGALPEDISQGIKVVNYFATDFYKREINIARDWYLKGYVDENIAILNPEDVEAVWNSNGAFCRFGVYAPGFGTPISNSRTFILGERSEPRTGTAEISVFGWMIPAASRNHEKAMQVLNEIFTNKELSNAICWGIEGEHYVKTGADDRQIRYPDGVTAETVTYNNDQNYAFGDFFGGLYLEGTPDNYDEICAAFNETKEKDTYLGFSLDVSNIRTPLAAISAVINQYDPLLGCGAVDPEVVLPEFLAALEGAGIQITMDEFQAQIDEYVAANPERFAQE